MKSYPAYKDSDIEWLGDIPKHWKLHRIKSAIDSSANGVWGDEAQGDDNDLICVRVADFDMATLGISRQNLTVRNINKGHQNGRIFKQGDLLIEKSGGGENQPVGRMIRFDLDPDTPSVCSNFVAKISVKETYVSNYLLYYAYSLYSKNINTRSIKQTTGIQNLDLESYINELMPVPPYSEQRVIANYLDHKTAAIDTLIAKKERQIELLQEQRAAVINQAVTRGLNPDAPMKDSGIEWIGRIPADWVVGKLRWYCQSIRDGTHNPPARIPGIHRLLSVRNIINGRFVVRNDDRTMSPEAFEELQRSYTVEKGDIVLAIVGGTTGKSAIVEDMQNVTVQRSLAILRPNHSKLISAFLNYWLQSHYIQNVINMIMIKYAAQPGIYLTDVSDLAILVPPRERQEEIVAFLEQASSNYKRVKSRLTKEIDLLQEYRTALISAAVTGKIDVRNEVQEANIA